MAFAIACVLLRLQAATYPNLGLEYAVMGVVAGDPAPSFFFSWPNMERTCGPLRIRLRQKVLVRH